MGNRSYKTYFHFLFFSSSPVFQPCPGHVLAKSSFFQKIFLQPPDLLVEKVVCLVDQADRDVGEDFRRACFHERAVGLIGLIGSFTQPADEECFLGVFLPEWMVADPQKVLIVEQEFLQLARATLVSLSSISVEVVEALLPSAIFCFPERAACTS